MSRWQMGRSQPSPRKVFCYIENQDKDIALCLAEGCWGGSDFLVQCIGDEMVHRDPRPDELQATASGHWHDVVIQRDGQCMAPVLDPEAGPCRNGWGQVGPVKIYELEADYVRFRAHGKRHELPIDHVALCPGHHRGTGAQGGHIWATSHREMERAYLAR